jgi:putative restriction endonuclease
MNRALDIKNWTDGGDNYVLKASSENKWAGFQEPIINKLFSHFGDD